MSGDWSYGLRVCGIAEELRSSDKHKLSATATLINLLNVVFWKTISTILVVTQIIQKTTLKFYDF